MILGQLLSGVRQHLWGDFVGWSRHELTGQFHTGAVGTHSGKTCLCGGGQPDQLNNFGQPSRFRLFAKALIGVQGQAHRFCCCGGGGVGFKAIPRKLQAKASCETARCLGSLGCGTAKAGQRECFRLAKAQNNKALGTLVVQQVEHHLLARFRFEILLFQGAAETAETLLEGAATGAGIVLQQANHQNISVPVLESGR